MKSAPSPMLTSRCQCRTVCFGASTLLTVMKISSLSVMRMAAASTVCSSFTRIPDAAAHADTAQQQGKSHIDISWIGLGSSIHACPRTLPCCISFSFQFSPLIPPWYTHSVLVTLISRSEC